MYFFIFQYSYPEVHRCQLPQLLRFHLLIREKLNNEFVMQLAHWECLTTIELYRLHRHRHHHLQRRLLQLMQHHHHHRYNWPLLNRNIKRVAINMQSTSFCVKWHTKTDNIANIFVIVSGWSFCGRYYRWCCCCCNWFLSQRRLFFLQCTSIYTLVR